MSAPLAGPLPAVRAEQPCPMVSAASTAQVITDRPDHKRDMVSRRGTEIGVGTSHDDLAFHDRHWLGDEPAVFAGPTRRREYLPEGTCRARSATSHRVPCNERCGRRR